MTLRRCLWILVIGTWASVPVAIAQTTGTTTGTTATSTSGTGGTGIGAGGGIGSGNTAAPQNIVAVETQAITGSAGSATTIPSSSNPFNLTYVDPLSLGLPSKYSKQIGSPAKITGTFGKGIWTTTTTNVGTGKATTSTTTAGFSTYGTPRAPVYMTALSEDFPRVVHVPQKLQGELRATIDRSSFIKNKEGIQVVVNGNIVELHGQVANDRERRLIEGMMSMTPGVRQVNNQLVVSGKN
ncbi:MAG: BON domain-containing protein [Gemmataceae bacterium]|nr:BON domain-containing protein [Gemmataceae bacterium]